MHPAAARHSIAPSGPTALSLSALQFRNAVVVFGAILTGYNLLDWHSADLIKYIAFLGAALAVSGARIGFRGRLEVPAPTVIVLFAIENLGTPETVLLAALTTLGPTLWSRIRGIASQERLVFPAAVAVIAAVGASRIYASPWLAAFSPAIRISAAALALFVVSSAGHALLQALDQQRSFVRIWRRHWLAQLATYVSCAGVAHLAVLTSAVAGWETVLLTGPVLYLVYRTYVLYLRRLEDGRLHAEEMAALHLRTIEALALAIDAKDHTTHDHLQRVKVYAREIATELGLSDDEQQALQAAALLHDIGKLAVPEHIISKPGRLTPDEFEKMKIHPVVGAEILERVRFPYPVAPIVRAHHEKWDGSGYPNGLRGEQIPIGARILAAVDCLDALASDRQYRRALPLEEAIKVVQQEAGKAFDPRVVEILSRRYVELEKLAQAPAPPRKRLSTDVKVGRGQAPAAGFETTRLPETTPANGQDHFLLSIAAARQEVQTLFEISQDLGNSLSLDETLSVLSVRLRRIIPHHAAAVWLRQDDMLFPAHVNGEDYRLFSSLRIPLGQGLSGWVAQNAKPIVNGNPAVETAHLGDPEARSTLRSAVAVPLEGHTGVVGVLALYHLERDAFTRDHLRVLSGISTKIGLAIDNALRLSKAESSATTDYITNLPNARSLFLQLDAEIARSRRENTPLTVLVLDMDGLKTINDRFGHLEGNRVLADVAAGLKSVCRDYDYVARMGGDEFVVLIPGLHGPETRYRVDQFRQAVAAAGVHLLLDEPLSASIGRATFPQDGHDAAQLLAEADRRMYQEKRARKEARTRSSRSSRTSWIEQDATYQ
jgi:diguanylate cyclase (GGDEF)-like protein/putative nucleotidyltransferase with HDIG domain